MTSTRTFEQARNAQLAALQARIDARFGAGQDWSDLQAEFNRVYNSACNLMAGTGDDLDFVCVAPAGHAGEHTLVDAYSATEVK